MSPDQQPWANSQRRSQLPPDWAKRRQQVRARAGNRCEHVDPDGTRCPAVGTECHHAGGPSDHRVAALRWICHDHHARETAAESAAARRAINATGRYPNEPNPGIRR